MTEPFVPRTCTLIGELAGWFDDDRSVAIGPPQGSDLPPRLVNWNATRATGTSADSLYLPGYVAAPFVPRDDGSVAVYDPWSDGDLVIFQASTFQPLVVLGAYGRKIKEFEKEQITSMRGSYRIQGTLDASNPKG